MEPIYDLFFIPNGQDVPTTIAFYIWRFIILSVLFGWLLAKMTSKVLASIFNDMILEVSIPLVMCYLSYYLTEVIFEGSGVLACVVFGLLLDKNSISPQNMNFLHKFFHMLGHLANTLIFFMVGIVAVDVLVIAESFKCEPKFGMEPVGQLVLKGLIFYAILTVIRLCSNFIVKPFMRQKTKQFDVTYKEVLVSTNKGCKNNHKTGVLWLAYCVGERSFSQRKNVRSEVRNRRSDITCKKFVKM